uniref:Uncharacterized protein n=1 Tax=Arundo donax TaxID=35708 RepID=A0A0A8ZYQ4_ARUDO
MLLSAIFAFECFPQFYHSSSTKARSLEIKRKTHLFLMSKSIPKYFLNSMNKTYSRPLYIILLFSNFK